MADSGRDAVASFHWPELFQDLTEVVGTVEGPKDIVAYATHRPVVGPSNFVAGVGQILKLRLHQVYDYTLPRVIECLYGDAESMLPVSIAVSRIPAL